MEEARRMPFSERINRSEKIMKGKLSYRISHSDYPVYSFLLIQVLILGITLPFYFLTYESNFYLIKDYINHICIPTFEFEKFSEYKLILIGHSIGNVLTSLNILRFIITFYHWIRNIRLIN